MGRPAFATILFGLTTFAGAFLLFQVQPLIAKYILPWFGGTPAIWTTCMLFFQIMLLVGYAYAHAIIRFLPFRAQVIVHLCVLAGAIAMLPIVPSDRWIPTDADHPAMRILGLLTVSLGVPYLALSATAPLIQGWFAQVRPGDSPYRLYALSNAASLLALISYPVLIEPLITRTHQAQLWSVMFVIFAIVCAATAIVSLRSRQSPAPVSKQRNAAQPVQSGWRVIALWLILPTCGSVMLLAITNKICQDVAVVPLLWVVPLTIYLLTFIICFDRPQWYVRRPWIAFMAISITAAAWVLLYSNAAAGVLGQTAIYCTALFAACMVYHGELVRLRPEPRQLTLFYLMVAAGGAIGGVLVAIVAPLVFKGFLELDISLFLSLGIAAFLLWQTSPKRSKSGLIMVSVAIVLMLSVLGFVNLLESSSTIERRRNFYGVLSVAELPQDESLPARRSLAHGGVLHGMQFLTPERRDEPTSYYTVNSGIGIALRTIPRKGGLRVGAVGLGAGTTAIYGQDGDTFRFYDINPEVERLARQYFTFLSDSHAKIEVILGDARMSLSREESQKFDVMILDAFSGDAIPVHLLTKECFDIYLRHLKPGGLIAVHVSNKYLDLAPVVAKAAEQFQFNAGLIDTTSDLYPSTWVMMSADPNWLGSDALKEAVIPFRRIDNSIRLWTDDDTNLIQILF